MVFLLKSRALKHRALCLIISAQTFIMQTLEWYCKLYRSSHISITFTLFLFPDNAAEPTGVTVFGQEEVIINI